MERETAAWDSPHTGTVMRLVRLGRGGAPLVYLPSSGGDHTEFERFGLHEVAAGAISRGALQVFSVDGRGPHTLFDPDLPRERRMAGYARFERYLRDELLPWVAERAGGEPVRIVGASYGAFAAANLLFKCWDRVAWAAGLGGVYEMWHRLDGYHDEDVYFHTPLEYLPRLEDSRILDGIRRTGGLALYAAAGDPWLPQTQLMARVLREKRLPHRVSVWPRPADHHERWWRRQFEDLLKRAP